MDYRRAYLYLFNEYTSLSGKLEALNIEIRKAQETAEMLCIEPEEVPPIEIYPKK